MSDAIVEIDGPRLAPASGQAPKNLVILSHGYGSDGNDLIALGNYWRGLLPDAAFVAPHAPQPCDMAPMGYQWFPINTLTPGERIEGAERAAPALDAFIDRELDRHGLEPKDLALVGFSQGTMMSLYVGLRRPLPVAGILGYSGMLVGEENLAQDIRSKPPVLLIHGDQDELIPPQASADAAEKLTALDVPVEYHISRGVPHSIGEDGLLLGGQFLKKVLSS